MAASAKPPTESAEQVVVMDWARLTERHVAELRWLHAVPNGGWRNPVTANRLRREGVKSGVPDLFLDVPARGYHGLRIEMKRVRGGRTSPEQVAWIAGYTERGYLAMVCNGAADAIAAIRNYLGIAT